MTYTELIFLNSSHIPDLYTVTNPYVTDKLKKIKSSEYLLHSSIGYSLLGKIISERFNVDINKVIIRENEFGKPYFPDLKVKFNISHTNNAVACSVSESEVGVDVERISTVREKILKLYSPREREGIRNAEDFYKLWTLKESALKLTGTGVSDIKKHEFTIKPEIAYISAALPRNVRHKSFVIDGYVLSVSSSDEIAQPIIIR